MKEWGQLCGVVEERSKGKEKIHMEGRFVRGGEREGGGGDDLGSDRDGGGLRLGGRG